MYLPINLTPIAGRLSDIYGKKRVYLVIMIVYAAGVPIAGFSTNISTMLIGRGLQKYVGRSRCRYIIISYCV
ncbi:MAG: MFS transporter [Nitrososphaeraceae archaeon]|nr:MFS transporter [Nitrososphaeraceae archaeon]MBV9667707.1 MFS transporter [Nitrososphaeraceae archaeon]